MTKLTLRKWKGTDLLLVAVWVELQFQLIGAVADEGRRLDRLARRLTAATELFDGPLEVQLLDAQHSLRHVPNSISSQRSNLLRMH